jgi:hypothetical protein
MKAKKGDLKIYLVVGGGVEVQRTNNSMLMVGH